MKKVKLFSHKIDVILENNYDNPDDLIVALVKYFRDGGKDCDFLGFNNLEEALILLNNEKYVMKYKDSPFLKASVLELRKTDLEVDPNESKKVVKNILEKINMN